ncbi:Tat pathway signal protein [Kribbella albertanoniae]|uniref:helix-turn-helix domain-containing protein n=1 Tax=Kribbella albertanoniae TaxID=1266829 RepID=UPI0014053112|nr:helix-turn-helix transcriptional regulator [Kribbella albertanoniae]
MPDLPQELWPPARGRQIFGTELRRWRQTRDLSLRQLAPLTHHSYSLLSRVEKGERTPSADLARHADSALDTGGALLRLWNLSSTSQPRSSRSAAGHQLTPVGWTVDTLTALSDLRKGDVDIERRSVLRAAGYSIAALALPGHSWWDAMVLRGAGRSSRGGRRISAGDLEAIRETVDMFTRIDQRRGGGHARSAVVQYLTSDVAGALTATHASDEIRRGLFSTAGELAYLSGWMAFDNAEHVAAQRHFTVAVQLAAEADDPPLAGHILRAMAHQAVDLGHHRQAAELAKASLAGPRSRLATHRERALLEVVHAKALAGNGQKAAASRALLRAEDQLAAAGPGDEEPGRMFFFGEASLAHETACTLRDLGDLPAATAQFHQSVRTRKATTFTRTHAVTLGYLGQIQARQGAAEEACATWSTALDAMDGVTSARTRQTAVDMRPVLATFRSRGVQAAHEVDQRAANYLAAATH